MVTSAAGTTRQRNTWTAETRLPSFSEQLDPQDVHRVMARAFELMLHEVHRYKGTVNQFLGDRIMALFGVPITHEDHAQPTVHAALGIRTRLEALRQDLLRERALRFDVPPGREHRPGRDRQH